MLFPTFTYLLRINWGDLFEGGLTVLGIGAIILALAYFVIKKRES